MSRQSSSNNLQKNIINSLAEMGVIEAQFDVIMKCVFDKDVLKGERPNYLSEYGLETVEFYLSTNPGLQPRPLAQVASGGELSRLLLALKEAVPIIESEATIIFDEIDTGVSGKIARLVGKKLKHLAARRQLFAITHLPQIASLADHHLKVTKRNEKGGTISEINELNGDARRHELAVLLSGGSITEDAMKQADNLIQNIG